MASMYMGLAMVFIASQQVLYVCTEYIHMYYSVLQGWELDAWIDGLRSAALT